MSNYRPNGPGAEQRPRDQGWATRREQHREPYPNRPPQPQRNVNAGEPSGEGRRNNFHQSRPAGNRQDFPSSGQYVPLSRRNQFDVDRRPDLRTEVDNRPFRPAVPGPPTGPALRQPPTAPRDQNFVQHNGRGEGVDPSRRHDPRNDRYVASASEPHRSSDSLVRDKPDSYRPREESSRPGAGGLSKDVDMDDTSSRRSRKETGVEDAAEPPRKRARRSPSYEPYEKKFGHSQDLHSTSSIKDRDPRRDIKRNATDTRRSSFRDDRSDVTARHVGDRHREKEDIKPTNWNDRHDRRNGGRDFDDADVKRQGSHRKTTHQEHEGSQGKRGSSKQEKHHATASKKYPTSPRTSHRHRRDSPIRSRRDHGESSRRSKHEDAGRSSKSGRETRRSPSVSTKDRRRARSTSISSSDSERSRSRRRRRYSRSTSSSSGRYRQRRRGRSPRSSSPDSSRRERRKRKYDTSPETSRSPSPKRPPRLEERNREEARESHQQPSRVWQANNGNDDQRNGGLSQTRSAPVKIAMPLPASRQAPGGPASLRNRPQPSKMPHGNGHHNSAPRMQQPLNRNAPSGPRVDATQTVPQVQAGGVYIPDIRSSLQMQHAIYEDMLASASPDVKDVLAALIRSDPDFTADVDSFWIQMTRQLPTAEQLQMLRVLQGQYMVLCDLERQVELEAAFAKNVADNSTTGLAPGLPESRGIQAPDTLDPSQASESASQQESKKSTQESRKNEDIAKAEKVKRREARPALPYEKIAQVGEGTYGKVYKARNSEGLGLVALKRIRMEGEKDGFPVTAMREIKLLQGLDHVNIVKLHEMMISNGSVHMVMEYMDHDLSGILSQPQITLSVANLKSFCQQMLRGLAYLHGKAILHRDMKGSNILINSKGELKLADFGLARYFTKRKRNDYTNRVVTLWYRSPELLLGETMYDVCIDNWSAGCIMLELFVRKPVFQGNDEIHQLEAIYEIMGTPTEEEWPGLASMPWYELVKPKEVLPSRFDEYFSKRLNTAGTELAKGLLHYDPAKRLTADQALESPFFSTEEPAPEIPTHIADIVGEWHEMEAKHERARRKQRET